MHNLYFFQFSDPLIFQTSQTFEDISYTEEFLSSFSKSEESSSWSTDPLFIATLDHSLLEADNMRPITGAAGPVDRLNSVYVVTLMIGGAARDLLITICQAY